VENNDMTIKKIDPAHIRGSLRKYALLIGFIILFIVFSISHESFLTVGNLLDVIRSNAISGLGAIGLTYVVLSGGIDLSIEGVIALSGVVAATLSYNPILAVAASLCIGLTVGFVNGFIITKSGVQPFIYTLGVNRAIQGLVLILTRGISIYDVGPDYKIIGKGSISGIPIPIWIFVILFIITYLLLNRTKFGRYVYSVGSNEEASRLSGIKTNQIKMSVYLMSAFLAALAGIVLTSRVSAAEPTAATGWSLDALAAVIIGGTSLRGGQGGILSTLLGIFLIGILNNGMILMNVPSHYYQFAKGFIIIVAVLIDRKK
jgi:ribose/xylose/arabinose/galactoside ABC-type transport system permease subunit